MIDEALVEGGDRHDRRLHRLFQVPRRERGTQALFGLGRAQEQQPQRRSIDGGRSHLRQIDGFLEQFVGHGNVEKPIVGPGLVEQLRQSGGVERIADSGM